MDILEEREHVQKTQRLRQGAATGFMAFLAWGFWQGPGSLFQWHPLLMAFAYMGLMAEGVSLGRRLQSCRGVVERQAQLEKHVTLMTLCAIVVVIGILVAMKSKQNKGKPHLTSWHSYAGLAAVLTLFLQGLIGAFMHLPNLRFPLPKQHLRTAHIFVSVAASTTGTIAMLLGFNTAYASTHLSYTSRLAVGIAVIGLQVNAFLDT
eukprot:TRINITY_DN24921_c0_g1_i1.p2 TRINITY_DN24921_c0_g1~~TRINITY_DN24921_c0_g1_i1.p2  ORF type:complete len:206 (+),score=33.20 TRINITY_DN24921_c0_g1_i1:42-659(+)